MYYKFLTSTAAGLAKPLFSSRSKLINPTKPLFRHLSAAKLMEERTMLDKSFIPDRKSCGTVESAQRNRQEICDNLKQVMDETHTVLEIASGTGTHVEFLANHYKNVNFTPSDGQEICVTKLREISDRLDNVMEPGEINMMDLPQWLVGKHYDGLLAINFIHISPFEATANLFKLARDLKVNWVSNYGPYKIDGKFSCDNDVKFDQSLKSRDSRWGVRDIDDVKKVAGQYGFQLQTIKPTKANNWFLIWKNTFQG